MHWNGIYKSEHLIITSRFTNAIAFNPPVPVGTDSGLEFCLPFACLLAFLYVVLSHQICIQWCIYSKWKRHIRYGSYIAWHACICTQILHTHNSFGAVSVQLVLHWIPFFKCCCSLVTNWNESESTTRNKFTTAITQGGKKVSSHDKYLFGFSAIHSLVANKNDKINQNQYNIVFSKPKQKSLCTFMFVAC